MPSRTDCRAFFDAATGTVSYVLSDLATGEAAVIDPVLEFDARSGCTGSEGAQAVIAQLRTAGLQLRWILETHAHADHLSAAAFIQQRLGGEIAIGARIAEVQAALRAPCGLGPEAAAGRPFDRLLHEGDTLMLGALPLRVWELPGHTPACLGYSVEDQVFVGDTLFMPDVGSARCDFPGGDAATLYRSIRRLLALPGGTRLMHCHDYPPAGRAAGWQSTVAEQRAHNIHAHDGIDQARFVALRQARDADLPLPALWWPALQVNLRAGRLPAPDASGPAFLRLPLNALPVR